MPVLPSSVPVPASGQESQKEATNSSAYSSWMDQAQNRQIQASQEARNQEIQSQNTQKFQAILPALVAEGQANLIDQQNKIAQGVAQQNARSVGAPMATMANEEFLRIMGLSTQDGGTHNYQFSDDAVQNHEQRTKALSALQSRVSGLELVPEQRQVYNLIEEAKKNEFDMWGKHLTAQTEINARKYMADATLEKVQLMSDNAALREKLARDAKPDVANTIQQNSLKTKAFTDISTQRDALSSMGYAIGKMGDDIKAQQDSALGSGPITSNPILAAIRPTSRQVDADIGDFANRIMSTVKNIRNINEFRAVTSSIPKSSDPAPVQNEKLQKLWTINQVLGQRNDYKESLLRANQALDPDDADKQAVAKFPFPGSDKTPVGVSGPSSASSDNPTVKVRDSKGVTGTIPASQLQDALKSGYSKVQ